MNIIDKSILFPEIQVYEGISKFRTEDTFRKQLCLIQCDIDYILQKLYSYLSQNQTYEGISQLEELLKISNQYSLKAIKKACEDFKNCLKDESKYQDIDNYDARVEINFQELLQATLITKNKLQYYLQQPIDISILNNLANKLNLQLVEDAREHPNPNDISKPKEEDCCTIQ